MFAWGWGWWGRPEQGWSEILHWVKYCKVFWFLKLLEYTHTHIHTHSLPAVALLASSGDPWAPQHSHQIAPSSSTLLSGWLPCTSCSVLHWPQFSSKFRACLETHITLFVHLGFSSDFTVQCTPPLSEKTLLTKHTDTQEFVSQHSLLLKPWLLHSLQFPTLLVYLPAYQLVQERRYHFFLIQNPRPSIYFLKKWKDMLMPIFIWSDFSSKIINKITFLPHIQGRILLLDILSVCQPCFKSCKTD